LKRDITKSVDPAKVIDLSMIDDEKVEKILNRKTKNRKYKR